MSKLKKPWGPCAYCGIENRLTEDHVVPKALFGSPRPGDIPRVLACTACNNEHKSGGDAYLIHLLLSDMTTVNHSVAKKLWVKFTRAMGRRQSQFAREIQWTRPVDVYTPSGIFLFQAYEAKVPLEHVLRPLKYMVRGLYRAYTGNTLPANTTIEVRRFYDATPLSEVLQSLRSVGMLQERQVGDGSIFHCYFAVSDTDPSITLWVLVFFERAIFTVSTLPQVATPAALSAASTKPQPAATSEHSAE